MDDTCNDRVGNRLTMITGNLPMRNVNVLRDLYSKISYTYKLKLLNNLCI